MQGVHGFEKLVAVKTILAEYATDPHYEAMFLDEARLIANIHAHNVAEILDLGSHDALLYLVLEWIEGDSLALLERSAIKHKRPIPVSVGLRILAQMCAGLNAAHELRDRAGRRLNVVHRDVSPQNVLLSVTGEVKLIDFGIAKALDQMSCNTNTGVVKGKVSFMAPEQALGQPLDARADIWSAGVVLYQLLTGELPFRGASQLETLHILGARRRAAPIPGLPTLLQKLLDRMLEPDRENRIGSAAELESELERVSALLGVATTRDVAAVVQEHLGTRIAARRETIDAALREADRRQRSSRGFDAPLERARHPDDATPAPYEPSAIVSTRPRPASTTPSFAPPSAHASLAPARVSLTSAPAGKKSVFPWWVAVAALAAVGLSLLGGAFFEREPLALPTQRNAAKAKVAPSSPAGPTAATLASVVPESTPPTVQATDLPLAAPPKKPVHPAVRAPAKHDVWSAFSEHR
jgi:serine/threonine-protein kinase